MSSENAAAARNSSSEAAAAGAAQEASTAAGLATCRVAGSAAVPSLRQRCLHVLASAVVRASRAPGDTAAGSAALACSTAGPQQAQRPVSALLAGLAALPQELQQELLVLLMSWRLLDNMACDLLCAASCAAGSSVLTGAAAVSLAGCVQLSPADLHSRLLCCSLPQLCTLSLRGMLWLTDADVAAALKHCPQLRRLDLAKCPQLTTAAAAAVGACAAAPQLRSLSLAGCWQVAALPGLAACLQLTSLDLSGCWQLTDAVLRAVLGSMPLLEELSLSDCSQLGSGILVSASLPAAADGPPPAVHAAGAAVAWAQGAAAAGVFALPAEPPPAVGQVRRRLQALGADVEGAGAAGAGGAGEAAGASEQAAEEPRFPLEGVSFPMLRSLDVSGTAADDCLLYWLAQRCCCRLQRLVLTKTRVTGLGLSALLGAKRALLHLQRCPGAQQGGSRPAPDQTSHTAQSGPTVVSPSAVAAVGAAVLPLLELSAGGTPAFGPSALHHALPSQAIRAQQQRWEAAQGGSMLLHLPPLGGGPGGVEHSSSGGLLPTVPFSLLDDSADVSCPYCPDLASTQLGPNPEWPPESQAGVLAALGQAGLGQLQALDVGGTGGCADLAALLAGACSSLQRLGLSGCRTLPDTSARLLLEALPDLRELDVSGCTGQRTSRPGSRFLRHKAPRLQEGGLTDESLCALEATSGPQTAPQGPPTSALCPAHSMADTAGRACAAAVAPRPRLHALNASGLSITDAALASLPPSVTSLQLRGCKRVGDSGLLQVLSRCSGLARLDASGCSQLTAAGLGCYTPFGSGANSGGAWQQQKQPSVVGSGTQAQQGMAGRGAFCGWKHEPPAEQALTQRQEREWQKEQQQGKDERRAELEAAPSLGNGTGGTAAPQLLAQSDVCRDELANGAASGHTHAPASIAWHGQQAGQQQQQPGQQQQQQEQELRTPPGAVRSAAADGEQQVCQEDHTEAGDARQRHQRQASEEHDREQALQRLRLMLRVVSTAAGVHLQRASLPKQACTREAVAWLLGLAGSSNSRAGGNGSREATGGSGSGEGGRETCAGGGSGSGGGGPAGCCTLQRLDLSSCAALEELDLLVLVVRCPQLRSLQLGAAGLAAGSQFCAALALGCRQLSRLNISGASLADADLATLLLGLPALQHLEVVGCAGIAGSVFCEQQQRLNRLAQRQAHAEGDAEQPQGNAHPGSPAAAEEHADGSGAGSLSRGAESNESQAHRFLLRTLRLDGCSVSDAAAVAIAATCPHLETLSLRQCTRVTGSAAAAALARCHNLRQLLLGGSGVSRCPPADAALDGWWPAIPSTPAQPAATPAAGAAGVLPDHPRASVLALVELPPSAAAHCHAWHQLLCLLGSPKLVYSD